MRISYSALETYNSCPQRYKFQEIDKIRGKKSKEAIFGTAVHGALEYMFSKDPLFPTLEEVLARIRQSITESDVLTEDQKIRYVDAGERMVRNFYTKNPPWNFTIIDLESRFEVALDDTATGKNHLLVGKIDRIDKTADETYEIIDYKTSSKLPSQDTVDKNLQLSLYQLGLQRRWPHLDPERVQLSLYFLKAGEKLSTKRTREELASTEVALLERIRTIEKKIDESDFPPLVSPLCGWCPYKPLCPAWKHAYSKEAPEVQKTGEELVNEYAQLKTEIAEREKELKKTADQIHIYLTTNGLERLFGDAYVLARKAQERSSLDVEKLHATLEQTEFWQSILSPDQKLVKKILPSLPPYLQEKVKEATIIKKFSVLGLSKKKPLEEIE